MLCGRAPGQSINFLAHSMGGLDCRHLISHLKPTEYKPVSLTTIATPHRGSPFMDWCAENIGIGKLKQKELELEEFVRDLTGHSHHHEKPKSAPSSEAEDASPKSGFNISLAALPSSFTTLLLSLLDSPAYANLTSTYLNTVFNPHTPDDPHVRYFSVAGRIGGMNIWHPLWLPKMVLDGYEARERERLGDQWHPLDGGTRWGNDGLVTVQSARWGEFLGIMEECDHWELRGARGIELDLWGGDSKGERDGWSLGDWGRFVKVWKTEEKKAREVGAAMSERLEHEREARERGSAKSGAEARNSSEKETEKDHPHGFADDVVKASTEKVSAVFDWIVDQVPVRNSSDEAVDPTSAKAEAAEEAEQKAKKSDLETKADLEKFYVALCRKLYDEGL
ncbi:hypothetical protein EIP86_010680 [Pleurotus ostreatoroseus]|nr:hypothetical protein EIP86_010680 [Pleurotus ostreatoroseus]